MNYLAIIQKYLPDILEELKEDILKEKDSLKFLGTEEDLNKIIQKQEELVKKYLLEFEGEDVLEQCEEFYKEVNLPYVIIKSNFNKLKKKVIQKLIDEGSDEELIFNVKKYIEKLANAIAKVYIKKDIQILKEIENSPFVDYVLYKSNLEWIKQIIKAIEKDNMSYFPLYSPKDSEFIKYLEYPESIMVCMDANLCSYLEELHKLIFKTAYSFYVFYSKGNYAESYLAEKDFIEQAFKLMKTISELYFITFSDLETNFFNLISYLASSDKRQFVSIIDIQNLKTLNKIYGEETVTQAITEIEKQINKILKNKQDRTLFIRGVTANFYMFNTNYTHEEIKKLIAQISEIVNKKLVINDKEIEIKTIIGTLEIEPFSEITGEEVRRILAHLKEEAKKREKKMLLILDKEEKTEILKWINQRYQNVNFIKNSIFSKNIELVFQPVIDIKTGKVEFVETLVRIINGEGRLIPAGVFIDLVYELGLISELDTIVLELLKEKQDTISRITQNVLVNVSYKSLISQKFQRKLKETIKKLDKLNLVFELTEQQLIENISIVEKLRKETGLKFAVDDFGAGYSSLKTVADLAEKDILGILKIDGTLIKDLDKHENIQKIVYIISILCESLDLKAVAEFVENKGSFEALKDMGIHYGQGYYISKPKVIEELIIDVFSDKYKQINGFSPQNI
ncbi:EAL domain-containing protein [Persephonella sp. KM09-Lau-8]|uniref:EAL domain-containing protein n=1 Tax=Persephonella sp. KM09-Lau-8 TaxID=1158345 RepID=UPI0004975D8B|nr:EAL domain-containing protein [Persephonella sp. KM09-Lau-8]